MKSEQQDEQQHTGDKASRLRSSATLLTAHRVFAPILGMWGALLGGLLVLVLPAGAIIALTKGTPLATKPALAQPVLALLAALVLGGALFGVARAITRRARRRVSPSAVADSTDRRVRPINPARELGFPSLDEPVEIMPESDLPAPRALALAEFADLPGRNAVWVEEPLVEPELLAASESATSVAEAPTSTQITTLHPASAPKAAPFDPSGAALARLRAVPPSELSLAEMVERFAGAMHEHRVTAPRKGLTPQDLAAREAALADALKALAALSGGTSSATESEPLRAALAQLQGLRGAA